MKSRAFLTISGVLVVLILVAGACVAGLFAGRLLPATADQPVSLVPQILPDIFAPQTGDTGGTPQNLEELFVPFWQAWDLVHEQYYDQPVNDEELMRGAIRGMLDALGDEHTSYMDQEQYDLLNTHLQGEEAYEGIGAWVDPSQEYLTIISPMPNSPAEKAGLQSGDKIIAIDGVDMTGLDGEVVRKKVLGPAGSSVLLTIAREGQEPFDVQIVRASITLPSIEGRMLDENIAYVAIYVFSDKATRELHQELERLLAQNPDGLILDLRNNGGGLLDASIEVASEFIRDGVIVYEVYGDGRRETFEAQPGGLATQIPIVVLINQGSASASEIVAGAIQDRNRGPLVGETSFGKGSVQIPTRLKNEQGAVRITVAQWLTPNERTIHAVGLKPDYEVLINEEDIAAGRDPQLEKAIELLTR